VRAGDAGVGGGVDGDDEGGGGAGEAAVELAPGVDLVEEGGGDAGRDVGPRQVGRPPQGGGVYRR
jgi:hypothetical protein